MEDNAELGEVTKQLLELAGCSVQLAINGDEAVSILQRKEHGFDVVLSDIRMPGAIDGIALAEYIRRSQPGLAVVLMTGYSGELSKAAQGGLDVLQKPCSPQAVLDALSATIESKRVPDGVGAQSFR